MTRHLPSILVALMLGMLVVSLLGCSDGGTIETATLTDTATTAVGIALPDGAIPVDDPFSGGYPTYDDEATGLRVVFGTPDLGAGTSRVSFALFDDVGLISFPVLNVSTRFYPDGVEGDFQSGDGGQLRFYPFPQGSRGIYAGELSFPSAGLWALDVSVPQASGDTAHVVFPVEVAEEADAPEVGDTAPASDSRTAADQPDLHELTTSSEPDPRLYQTSIASALDRGEPFVVVFASPAFCTNALCGPQVEVLSELADEHGDDAAFIHVDLYENPREIQGDFSLARRTPVLDEWGLHTDEWTFVVNADGIVTARFEGFAPREEVEAALVAALDG